MGVEEESLRGRHEDACQRKMRCGGLVKRAGGQEGRHAAGRAPCVCAYATDFLIASAVASACFCVILVPSSNLKYHDTAGSASAA